jgi:hypothetical protein
MYLKAKIDIDSVGIVKLVKTDNQNNSSNSMAEISSTWLEKKTNSLTLVGISEENYLTFKYENLE